MSEAIEITGRADNRAGGPDAIAARCAARRVRRQGRFHVSTARSARCSRCSIPRATGTRALEANAEMNAEYIIFNHFMDVGRPGARGASSRSYLLDTQQRRRQLDAVSGRRGLPLDHDRSLLRAEADRDARRRRADDAGAALDSRRKGGIANCGTLARFYLAAMGQVPWDATAVAAGRDRRCSRTGSRSTSTSLRHGRAAR